MPADKYGEGQGKTGYLNVRHKVYQENVNHICDLLLNHPIAPSSIKPYLFLVDPNAKSEINLELPMTAEEFSRLYFKAAEKGQDAVDALFEKYKCVVLGGNHGYYGRHKLRAQLQDEARFRQTLNAYRMRGHVLIGADTHTARKVTNVVFPCVFTGCCHRVYHVAYSPQVYVSPLVTQCFPGPLPLEVMV